MTNKKDIASWSVSVTLGFLILYSMIFSVWVMLLVPIAVFLLFRVPQMTRWIYEKSLSRPRRRRVTVFEWLHATNFYQFFYGFYLVVAVLPLSLIFILTDAGVFPLDMRNRTLEGLIIGIALLTFVITEAPRIRRPFVSVIFSPIEDGGFGTPLFHAQLLKSGSTAFYIQIVNLGMNFMKNCIINIRVPDGCEIEPMESKCYESFNFPRKRFESAKRRAIFYPTMNYICICPGQPFAFPLCVRVDKPATDGKIQVNVSSETRFWDSSIDLRVEYVDQL